MQGNHSETSEANLDCWTDVFMKGFVVICLWKVNDSFHTCTYNINVISLSAKNPKQV